MLPEVLRRYKRVKSDAREQCCFGIERAAELTVAQFTQVP
jgi:hypothetical protein